MYPDVFEALTQSKYNAAIMVAELSKILNLSIQKIAVDEAISEVKPIQWRKSNSKNWVVHVTTITYVEDGKIVNRLLHALW